MLAFTLVFHVLHPAQYLDMVPSRYLAQRRNSDEEGLNLDYGAIGRSSSMTK